MGFLNHQQQSPLDPRGVDPQSSEGLKPSIDLVELPRLSVNFKSLRKGAPALEGGCLKMFVALCGCLWLFVVVCGCLWKRFGLGW